MCLFKELDQVQFSVRIVCLLLRLHQPLLNDREFVLSLGRILPEVSDTGIDVISTPAGVA